MTTQVKGSVIDQSSFIPFVPTYSTDLGNAAISFTGGGSITTSLARYRQIGKIGHIHLNFNGVTNGVTPDYLILALPSNWRPVSGAGLVPVVLNIGSTWETGQLVDDPTGFLHFYRANRVQFPASSTFIVAVKHILELQ